MSPQVRVRFAPSPTGHLHVGGARTALFNWLFARHHGGVFILRIEDTDRSRSTDEAIDSILEALRWLGLDWDEGAPTPGYRQTERMAIYRVHAEQLLATDRAYYCECSRDTLAHDRKAAQGRSETYRYPGTCRNKRLAGGALRLRIPSQGATVVHDLIHGPVTFEHDQLDDWVVVRTDGTPTYNFCVVVDDVTMRISHVIRGNDHLSNTPKQILCYEALGYEVPEFAHVAMILGADRSRMSKRLGATSVQAFRDMGIPSEAMVNYLGRLGWSHGDQEIFSRKELSELFDIKNVGVSGAVFDQTKLEWLSQYYLKTMSKAELAERAAPFFENAGYQVTDRAWLARVVESLKERAKTLVDLARISRFYFRGPDGTLEPPESGYERKAAHKYLLTPDAPARLTLLIKRLDALTTFTAEAIEPVYRELTASLELKLVDLAQLTRLAVTGGIASPPIFDVLELLGREESLARLRRAREFAGPTLQ